MLRREDTRAGTGRSAAPFPRWLCAQFPWNAKCGGSGLRAPSGPPRRPRFGSGIAAMYWHAARQRPPGSVRDSPVERPAIGSRRSWFGRRMPGSARCPVFILSVAATISLCTDPAAGGGTRAASTCARAAVCSRQPDLLDCRGAAGTMHAECIGQRPVCCRAAGEHQPASTGALLRRLRGGGGAPTDSNRPWNMRAAGGHDAFRPFTDTIPPRNTWSQANYQLDDPLSFYDERDSGAQNPTGQAFSRPAVSWLHELLGAEPGAAHVAGDLANGGRGGGGGLVFANHGGFAAAAKTVAFLVGSAARDPREKAWRKVRRSNPALSQRLGEQGYRLLQSCGYSIEQKIGRAHV